MKISKLFHTLYGILMALPVLVIPIFAININQKSVEPISIKVQEDLQIDFNQWIPTDYKDLNITSYYRSIAYSKTIKANEKYMFKWDYTGGTTTGSYNRVTLYDSNGVVSTQLANQVFNYNEDKNIIGLYFYAGTGNTNADFNNIQLFNFTQMYGVGNEPTATYFNETFTNSYYNYTTSTPILIEGAINIYDDTDIGSQFLYSLYKPVNDYFNFKDFMGLGSLYDWILLNIFSGSNNLVFFILFNFFTYWIFVSFFWLIFDVLMYVPSLVHKMLDKARME